MLFEHAKPGHRGRDRLKQPPPQPQKLEIPQLECCPNGYNMTEWEGVPQGLLDATIAKAYVEFLNVDHGTAPERESDSESDSEYLPAPFSDRDLDFDRTCRGGMVSPGRAGSAAQKRTRPKTHAVWKFNFAAEYDGHYGVRVSMKPNITCTTGSVGQPGVMWLKPIAYTGASNSSVRTIQAPIADGTTVVQVMGHLLNSNLHYFDFVQKRGYYFGCRDWMVQTLCILEMAGCVGRQIKESWPAEPPLPAVDLYEALGMCYKTTDPIGEAHGSPIDVAVFPHYRRATLAVMPYRGTHKAEELCSRVP